MDDIYSDLFELNVHDMDELQYQVMDKDGEIITKPDADNILVHNAPDVEINDEWINTSVPIPHAGELVTGTVKKRKRNGASGLLVGKANDNPLLGT